VQPHVGLNVIEVRALSSLGGESNVVQAYIYAHDYQPVAQALAAGATLYTAPEVWDDDDLSDVDDVATVVDLILDGIDLEQVLPDTLGEFDFAWCSYELTLTSFSIGDPDVELTPVDGALRIVITYPDIVADLHAEGGGFGCVDNDPHVTADSIQIALHLSFWTEPDGTVGVSMSNEAAVLENLDVTLSGVAGFLFNWLVDFFEDNVTSMIEAQVVDQLAQFPTLLASAIESMAVNVPLNLNSPVAGPTSLDLTGQISDIDFDDSGGEFDISVAVTTPSKGTSYDALGSVLRQSCAGWGGDLSFPKASPLEFGISDDVINQALLSLWWAGGLDGSAMSFVPNDDAFAQYGTTLDSLEVTFLLPPVLSDCGPDGLTLSAGDIRIDAVASIAGNAFDLAGYASIVLTAQAVLVEGVAGAEVGIKIGQPVFVGVELSEVPEPMKPVQPLVQYVVMEHALPPLLESVTGQILTSYPIPALPLDGFLTAVPPGTSIELDLESVGRKDGHTLLTGSVK